MRRNVNGGKFETGIVPPVTTVIKLSTVCIKLRRLRDCFIPLFFGFLSIVFVTKLRYIIIM